MAAPYFSPSGGAGSTYNDPASGVTYRFDGRQWTPISSGAAQGPRTMAPVGPNANGNVLRASTGNGGNGGGGNGGNGNNGGGGNGGNISNGPDFAEIMRRQKEEGLRSMGAARDEALRYAQEARGLLQKKRGQFTDLFNEGRDTILDTSEQARGQAQAADLGSEQKAKGTLSAMGLGGSALERLLGKQMQARTRAQGELSTMRDTNERANTRTFNDRQDWANTQENAIGASERAANEQYQAGANTSELNFGGALASMLASVQAQQAAARAAAQSIGGYEASPYAVTGMDPTALISSLQSNLGGMGLMGGNTAVDNAGVSIPQNPQNEVWKKLMGLRA